MTYKIMNKLIEHECKGREPVLFLDHETWYNWHSNGEIIDDTYHGFPVIRVIGPPILAVVPTNFEIDFVRLPFNSVGYLSSIPGWEHMEHVESVF